MKIYNNFCFNDLRINLPKKNNSKIPFSGLADILYVTLETDASWPTFVIMDNESGGQYWDCTLDELGCLQYDSGNELQKIKEHPEEPTIFFPSDYKDQNLYGKDTFHIQAKILFGLCWEKNNIVRYVLKSDVIPPNLPRYQNLYCYPVHKMLYAKYEKPLKELPKWPKRQHE